MLAPPFFVCLTLQVHEIEKSLLDYITPFGLYERLKNNVSPNIYEVL